MNEPPSDGDRVTFLVGGARSGKSRIAVAMAETDPEVLFLATARPSGPDMERRVARHRRDRPDGWETVEEPLDIPGAVRRRVEPAHTVILDCLTLWVANLVDTAGDGTPREDGSQDVRLERTVLRRAEELVSAIADAGRRWIVVSNEVGTGLHPTTRAGRRFRDLLGLANQRMAAAADRTLLVVAGRTLELERPPARRGVGTGTEGPREAEQTSGGETGTREAY